MSEATATTIINMPIEDAWSKLQDFSLAHNYVPGIIKTEITTEKKNGVGASRKVYQSKTRALEETIIEWNEGKGFKIRLHKGDKDAPFKGAFFKYELMSEAGDKTKLVTTMGYTPPLLKVGELLDKAFLNKVITGVIKDVSLSLKHYYETGEPTTPKQLKKLKANA